MGNLKNAFERYFLSISMKLKIKLSTVYNSKTEI